MCGVSEHAYISLHITKPSGLKEEFAPTIEYYYTPQKVSSDQLIIRLASVSRTLLAKIVLRRHVRTFNCNCLLGTTTYGI